MALGRWATLAVDVNVNPPRYSPEREPVDMMTDPKRSPVIIGVGQINDRPDAPDRGLDSLGLMVAALPAAAADAGGGLPTDLARLAIVHQISFPPLGTLCGRPAAEVGPPPAPHTPPTTPPDPLP